MSGQYTVEVSPRITEEKNKTEVEVSGSTPAVQQSALDDPSPTRDARFWLVFVALCCCILLAALDLGGVGTAAPTILHDLNGTDITWVVSAYALSSAACIPLSGNLAQIFGRRPILLGGIVLFAAGSAISGSAPTLTVLIVGRAIQGIGDGCIQALTSIVTSDLVPLRERGLFQGFTGLMWTLGSVIGPFIAGGLSEKASWRWLFYINIPLCVVALLVVYFFLRLRTPREALREKLLRVDWIGNALIMASSISCMLALTWGGNRFPWSSPQIIAPLVVGVVGMAFALLYEAKWSAQPTIPMSVLSNRTSFSGYFASFLAGMVTIGIAFYLPTWFQSVREADPIKSGLYFLPLTATISPSAIIQGLIVAKTGRYRFLNFVGWSIMLLGGGLLIFMHESTSIGAIAVFQLILGLGMGLLYSTTFAVLAPLHLSQNAAAISLLTFLRIFSQAWGAAVGGAILQNELRRHLPSTALDQIPDDGQIAYTIIPLIPTMAEPLRSQVRGAFYQSMRLVWIAMEVFSGVGLFTFFAMKDIPLRKTVDKQWGMEETREGSHARQSEVERGPSTDHT